MWAEMPMLQIQVLDRMDPSDMLPAAVVAMALLTATVILLTKIIVANWREYRERRMAASLIQEMLDRNMTAAEIQQVMSSWGGSPAKHPVPNRPPLPAKPVA